MEKIVVITGGSRGIGKETAVEFARAGYSVALVSQNAENLEKAKTELKVVSENIETFQCDIKNIEQVKNTVENIFAKFSRIDVLVNNAGISKLTPLETGNYEDWKNIIDINLSGAFYFSREAFLKMRKTGGGRIINISSIYGLTGGEGYSAYCASKHGLIGLTRAMALEAAKYNITVNAVCPGWVETDMFSEDMKELSEYYRVSEEDLIEGEKMAVPLKRFTGADEIASLALYLASEQAKNITGQAINISGGLGI